MKTKIIGLTGGIGSGKTTIAKYFETLGIPVYIADEEAKKILDLPETAHKIAAAFGEEVLTKGKPDRKKLAAAVFNNTKKLELLNSIIHPKVRQHFLQWVEANSNKKIVIKEAAILFESGSYKDCDAVILVTAPKEVRIQRVMQRDNTTKEEVLERMSNQWEDEKKEALSDYVITNITLESAKRQAEEIIKKISIG